MILLDIIDKKPYILKQKEEIIDKLFDKTDSDPKYILGINEYCDKLLNYFEKKKIKVTGIIDDYTAITVYKKIPVFI